MPSPAGTHAVVIGVDIGTTSTISVAYDMSGAALGSHSVRYPLDEPHPGWAEQDPELIYAAVLETVRTVVAGLVRPIAGLSFSTAMHSLIGLDGDGAPITASVTWADTRSSAQAERIRASPGGLALHLRTGTPVHPMAPLPKLVWFREVRPRLCERVAHWVGIKDYVLLPAVRDIDH
jgi:gluconokinase